MCRGCVTFFKDSLSDQVALTNFSGLKWIFLSFARADSYVTIVSLFLRNDDKTKTSHYVLLLSDIAHVSQD